MIPRISALVLVAIAFTPPTAAQPADLWLDACLSESVTQRAARAVDKEHTFTPEYVAPETCVYNRILHCRFSTAPEECSKAVSDQTLAYVTQVIAKMPSQSTATGKAKQNYEKRLGGMRRSLPLRQRITNNPNLSEERRQEGLDWWDAVVERGRHPWLSAQTSEHVVNAEFAIRDIETLRRDLELLPE